MYTVSIVVVSVVCYQSADEPD